MKKSLSKILKTFVATTMAVVMLAGGSLSAVASAADEAVIMPRGSARYTTTLKKGSQITFTPGVEKSISNVDATITMYSSIPVGDLVTAYVINDKGSIVSSASAQFNGTTPTTVGKAPYRTGTGIAGNKYKLVVSLKDNSKDDELKDVSLGFIP